MTGTARQHTGVAELPALDFQISCGHCGAEVAFDEGVAHCEPCGVEWGTIEPDAIASPDSMRGDLPPCGKDGASRTPYDYKGRHWVITERPCVLPAGHTSRCLNPEDFTVTDLDVVSGNDGGEA